MTVEQIIQNSIQDFKQSEAKARRDYVRKLIDYYCGTNTTKYISKYFDADAFREIPCYEANFTRRFINKMSRIYNVGANRNVNPAYSNLSVVKDARMKHIERMTRLVGSVATQIVYREGDMPYFDYIPVYYFDVHLGEDPFKPEAIMYPILGNVSDVSYAEKLKYAYWDNAIYAQYDEDGNVEQEYEHGYGVLPFLFTHKENQIDNFFVDGADDIVSCNEHVNITMTELQLGLRFQMFGQPYVTGLQNQKKLERAGSDTILDLPEGSIYDIVAPEADLQAVIETIKFQVDLVAQNMYEHELYHIEKEIADYNGIKLPESIKLDFNEPEYPKTMQDQILWDNHRLENNLTTQAKLLVEYNDDLSIKEAEKLVAENKQQNQEQSIFERIRQQNQNTQG